MKGSIFLLLAAVALSKGARLSWSDCLNKETVNILVPHENCHKFYQCDDGKLITRRCPAKLMFNIEDQRCDWPDNVDCQNRGIPDGSDEEEAESGTGGGHNDPSEAPAICAAEESDGILIAHEYCDKYYICSDGAPVAMSCPRELFFNADIDQCDWPKNVDCDREVAPQPHPEEDGDEIEAPAPETQPEPVPEPDNGDSDNNVESEDDNRPVGAGNNDPSQAPEICAAEESDGILIAHEYCNKFYICHEGKPVALYCPQGLFFNANKDQCDWPKKVKCDREIAPQPQPQPEEDGDDDSVVVVPEPEQQPEPVPEPDNGDGNNSNESEDDNKPVGAGNNDPSQAPEICAAEESDGILIAHEYCNKFYICHEGKPVALYCPQGLFFNANKDQCDWPKKVKCDREIAPQPQPQPEEDGDDDSVVVVPEPEQQPEAVPEPDNGDGNNSNESEDDNKPVGAGNNDPSQAPEICAAEESDGILIAHEYCNKFYICHVGKPVALYCPQGLFFNANKDQCDWPKKVECDREIAPQPQPQPEEDGDDDSVVVVPEPEQQPEAVPEPDNGDGNNSNESEDDNKPVGAGNNDPSQAPEICAAEESDGILIAHEYCNKFYICHEGKPVALYCPQGLFFNANKDQCDWPKKVKCDREIAPQPQPQPEEDGDDDSVVVVPEPEQQPEAVPEPDNGDGNNSNESEDDNKPVGAGNNDPSQAPEICAAEESDGILIAHEYCNKFYICHEGKPVALYCPQGLFFNANKDQCDWPKKVKCDREIAPQPQPQPEEDGDDDSVVVVPEPEQQPEAVPEPDNGDGNNSNESEDDNKPVGAGNNDPSQAPEICAAEESDGILIAHEYCNKFYICHEGKPVALYCPQGLLFNANKDQCDWPKKVECDREIAPQPQPQPEEDGDDDSVIVAPEPEQQPEPVPEPDNGAGDNSDESEDNDKPVGAGNNDPSQASEICAAEESDGILIAHEYCNKFYICHEGKPIALYCPQGLLFNANKDQCDWPKKVECDREIAPQPQPQPEEEGDNDSVVVAPEPEQQPEPMPESDNGDGDNSDESEDDDKPVGAGNNDPSQAPEICAAEESDGILIAHEYCNKFYICREGKPVALSCPQGLFFNANKDQCDWPKNVECDREIAPQPQPQSEEDGDNDSVIVAPEPEQQPELVPEPDNGAGNNSDESEDNDKPVGAGNNDPSQASEICAAENSHGILIAHEYCNKFYICSKGKPVTLSCPKGLFFNANKDQCDWPKNVECDREIAPQPQPQPEEDGDNDSVVVAPEPQPEESEQEPKPDNDNVVVIPWPEAEPKPDNDNVVVIPWPEAEPNSDNDNVVVIPWPEAEPKPDNDNVVVIPWEY